METETPAERVMRQWFQMRIAERAEQLANFSKNRAMLRRGARKMQDGKLGHEASPAEAQSLAEDETMLIRVGDEIHYYQSAEPKQNGLAGSAAQPPIPVQADPSPVDSDARKATDRQLGSKAKVAAIVASIILGGAAIPAIGVATAKWLGLFDQPAASEAVDTDTTRRIEIEKWVP